MATVCILQAGAAATSMLPGVGLGVGGCHDCRPDASGASSTKTNAPPSSGGVGGGGKRSSGFDLSSNGFLRPPRIPRLPPNIVRQLSIKARRNCSNIGVAQVVAASATDRPSLDAAISTLPQSADVLGAQQQLGSSAHATDGGAAATSTFVIDSTLLSQAIAATTTTPSCNNGSLPVEKSKPMARGTLAVHGGAFSLSLSRTEVKFPPCQKKLHRNSLESFSMLSKDSSFVLSMIEERNSGHVIGNEEMFLSRSVEFEIMQLAWSAIFFLWH